MVSGLISLFTWAVTKPKLQRLASNLQWNNFCQTVSVWYLKLTEWICALRQDDFLYCLQHQSNASSYIYSSFWTDWPVMSNIFPNWQCNLKEIWLTIQQNKKEVTDTMKLLGLEACAIIIYNFNNFYFDLFYVLIGALTIIINCYQL